MTIAEEKWKKEGFCGLDSLKLAQSVEKASYEKGLKDGEEKSFAGNSLLFKKGYAEGQKATKKECLLKFKENIKIIEKKVKDEDSFLIDEIEAECYRRFKEKINKELKELGE
jgi:hypothetical protein